MRSLVIIKLSSYCRHNGMLIEDLIALLGGGGPGPSLAHNYSMTFAPYSIPHSPWTHPPI